jgi:BMFP domain-containing protein YqiC
MENPRTIFEQLADAVAGVLPADPTGDFRKNVQTSLKSACDRMNLVTREELEVQEAVLQRTREKVEKLEAQVAALEAQLLAGKDTG